MFINMLADGIEMPRAGEDIPVTVYFTRDGEKELWVRDFNGSRFSSVQWRVGDLVHEKFGFTTLILKPIVREQTLMLEVQDVRILGISIVSFMRPQVITRETEKDGVYHFFIQVTLPKLGLLIQYEGSLTEMRQEGP